MEKNLQIAVFVDQVKIADYGQIQYLKASDYKNKSSKEEKKGSSPSKGRKE